MQPSSCILTGFDHVSKQEGVCCCQIWRKQENSFGRKVQSMIFCSSFEISLFCGLLFSSPLLCFLVKTAIIAAFRTALELLKSAN